MFALVPTRPPWMESQDVTRIIALRFGGTIDDSNPLAAMPSLHVAFPLMISFWFFRERWRAPALAMLAYSALIAFEVVFSGEHYVADVIGAAVVAGAIALASRIDYPSIMRWTYSRAREAFRTGQRELAPVAASRAPTPRRERAQALIEFAFVAPIIFVLLFSIVDFSIAIDRRLQLQHAVREGARYGAVHTNMADIKQYTVDEGQGLVDTTDVTVCYIDGDDAGTIPGNAGDAVRVSATLDWEYPILSEMAGVFGVSLPTIHMTPQGTARLEQSVPGATACP
jgi:hypothetical protein